MSKADLQKSDHEQNDNWVWSDAFTDFVRDKINGFSLKVGTGLRPICDVNLDIIDIRSIAESENAPFDTYDLPNQDERLEKARNNLKERTSIGDIYATVKADSELDSDLYNGFACEGDMFDLPFEDNTFDTVVSDPPWLEINSEDRKKIFNEVVRVTKPTGLILYNATWIPRNEHTTQYELRFRQQLDFWGGPSFIALHRRTARSHKELFEAYEYDSAERYPEKSPFWSEDFHPNSINLDTNANPHAPSISGKSRKYTCPQCDHPRLFQIIDPTLQTDNGKHNLYECEQCQFRATETELTEGISNFPRQK